MGFFNDASKLKNGIAKYLANTILEGLAIQNAKNTDNKPQFYQALFNLNISLAYILVNDASIPNDVKILADKLGTDLEQQMKNFDKDIATYPKSDHKKIERNYIKACYGLLYRTAPKLTAAPDLWNQVAATLNAFTQWAGNFDIIPEKWITRTPFFTAHHEAKTKLSVELSEIELSLKL